MMKKIVNLLMILMCSMAFAQNEQTKAKPSENEISRDSIYKITDIPAEFPGGIGKFRQLFAQNFDASSLNGKGSLKCEVTFVVLSDGKMDNVQVIGDDHAFNKEAKRAILSLKNTKWIPGKINNIAVKSQFRIPLNMSFE
ncbi:energy transducer TonB [Chryseobacterium sp.]|uniref:energy transducer TonB n=1 Tax=Chryseobacterium sp. TaxID=1871047 RepID=UPI00289ADD9B|nr:energy transducer TonB [Chryseobacterium sp.]